MKLSINEKVETIQVPGIRQFSNKLVDFPDAVNLTIGQPDFPTPEAVKKAGIDAIKNNETGYSHNAGLIELRQAVSSFLRINMDFSIILKRKLLLQMVLVRQSTQLSVQYCRLAMK